MQSLLYSLKEKTGNITGRGKCLYTVHIIRYNKIVAISTDYMKAGDCMTGREVVNLIQKLESEGMSAEKIIGTIKYVETAEPKTETK